MLLVIQSSIPGQQANNGLKSLQQSSPLLVVYLLCSLSRLWSLCHKVKNLRALSTQDGLMVCKLTHGNNDQQCLVSMPYGISVSMFITCHYLCSNVHFVLLVSLVSIYCAYDDNKFCQQASNYHVTQQHCFLIILCRPYHENLLLIWGLKAPPSGFLQSSNSDLDTALMKQFLIAIAQLLLVLYLMY